MKKIPLLFCLVSLLAGFASAQKEQSATCPIVYISGGGVAAVGEVASFRADVDSKGKDFNLEYIWKVDGEGEIISGQGTSSITIELLSERSITVTAEVKGFPEGCQNIASGTLGCQLKPNNRQLVDEFGATPNGDFRARMDAFFIALGDQPNAQGYIINYGTKQELARREKLLRNFITFKKYDMSRVTFVRGGANTAGEKGVWTKLWLVPPGSLPPTS